MMGTGRFSRFYAPTLGFAPQNGAAAPAVPPHYGLGQPKPGPVGSWLHGDVMDFIFDGGAMTAGIVAAGSGEDFWKFLGYGTAIFGGVRLLSHFTGSTEWLLLGAAGGVIASFVHYMGTEKKRPVYGLKRS